MIIAALVTIIGPLVWLAGSWKWIDDVQHGPKPVTEEQLSNLEDPAKLSSPYVTLTKIDKIVDSGIVTVKSTKGSSFEEKTYLLKVGDRWLMAQSKLTSELAMAMRSPEPALTGYLFTNRLINNKDSEVRAMVLAQHPDEKFYPFMIDLADQRDLANVRIWGVVIIVLFGIYLVWDSYKRMNA
jgi:hypothetical protein